MECMAVSRTIDKNGLRSSTESVQQQFGGTIAVQKLISNTVAVQNTNSSRGKTVSTMALMIKYLSVSVHYHNIKYIFLKNRV